MLLEKDIQEVLFTQEELEKRVRELAAQITADYQGKEIILISVLRGSFGFMADLCRSIDLDCTGAAPPRQVRSRLPRTCPATSPAST